MTYERIKDLKATDFKRLCGVSPETFAQMVEVVRTKLAQRSKPGTPAKLSIEDQILLTLEYWREYRTYFHIGQAWGLHESTVCRIIQKIETILIQSKSFRLPGKKQLIQPGYTWEVVVVDVTESAIERPKKNSAGTTAEKRENTPSRPK
jgi:Helix-turn-helix of DDE superfamily endonuclease